MARLIDCRVGPSSIVDVLPVRVARDGDDYVVGRHGARSYLALTPIALEATTLLGEQLPVGRVKELLAAKYGVATVELAPLLQQLLSAGLVRAIDGRPIQRGARPDPPRRALLTRERVAPLFGKTALVTYTIIFAGGLAALLEPRAWPRLGLLIAERSYGMLLLAVCLVAAIAAKHEFAHIAAGKFLGVDARWRLSHRLMFPVVETDLSDLWMVERRKRYVAYCAGVFSDLLAASLALMGTWAHVHGWIALPASVYRALELTVLLVAAGAIWQCNVFLRTDGYYVLVNALGSRNLAGDAKAYLRTRSAAFPRSVRLYAIGYVITVVVICGLWVFGVTAGLRAAWAGAAGTGAKLAVMAVVLLIAIAAERRRRSAQYRLVCPAGLSLLFALWGMA